MALYEVSIIEKGKTVTGDEVSDYEKIILAPKSVVAVNEKAAIVVAVLNETLVCNPDKIEVLVRRF